MATDHDDTEFPCAHTSPTDLLLTELQLYGHRPFQDEPDPRLLPEANVIGDVGSGLRIVGSAFAPAAAQVGVFGLALMRTAFDHALRFARAERRGGPVPIIDHQAVGYALASAKTRIEAVRSLTWRACHALDTGSPAGRELALHAKVFGSETAVAVITDLMQVVGVDGYTHEQPLGRLLQDALALPLFGGSNMGLRRRQAARHAARARLRRRGR